jgi:hypothetical protein
MNRAFPSSSSGLARDLLAAFRAQYGGAFLATFSASALTSLNGIRIAAVFNLILGLSRRDVANELREGDGVTRAFEAFRCHALIMGSG